MNQVLRTGFAAITHLIDFDPQKITKGKALAVSHVKRVEELVGINNSRLIRCSVIRTTSVTSHPYKVQLELNTERVVTNVSCTCVSGICKKCKHIYALIHFINSDRSTSKKSLEQEWGKPSDIQLGKDMYAKPLIISDDFKNTASNSSLFVKPYDLSYCDVQSINCPLKIVLKVQSINVNKLFIQNIIKQCIAEVINKSENSKIEACALSLINFSNSSEVILCDVNITNVNLKNYYEQHINVSEEQIVNVCVETVQQSENPKWFHVRKLRLSASSKAHAIKSTTKKSCEQLAEDFLTNKTYEGINSLEYGKKHEKEAINDYVLQTNAVVQLVGVFIMPEQPWICVSADAVVIENDCVTKVLEVKCPSSCQSKPVFDILNKKINVPYLYLQNDIVLLKESHQYYTQTQMLMYATGLTECDFFVWSKKGSCLMTVQKDDSFLKSLVPKLKTFYFRDYLPCLYNLHCEMEKENIYS